MWQPLVFPISWNSFAHLVNQPDGLDNFCFFLTWTLKRMLVPCHPSEVPVDLIKNGATMFQWFQRIRTAPLAKRKFQDRSDDLFLFVCLCYYISCIFSSSIKPWATSEKLCNVLRNNQGAISAPEGYKIILLLTFQAHRLDQSLGYLLWGHWGSAVLT